MTVTTTPTDQYGNCVIAIPDLLEVWSGDQETSVRVQEALAKLPDGTKYHEARRVAQEAARVG